MVTARDSADIEAQTKQKSETHSGEAAIQDDLITHPEAKQLSPTFTLFPKLAAELLLAVWHFALPNPQLIIVSRGECRTYRGKYSRSRACITTFLRGSCQQASPYPFATPVTQPVMLLFKIAHLFPSLEFSIIHSM